MTVGRPDLSGREAILKVHAKHKPLAPDVDLKSVAHGTVGFTGADLENLLNEAALLSARRNKKAITMTEIDEATIKVEMGSEKKSHKFTEKDKRATAYHEAGHAVAAYYLENTDNVYEVSIIPRGMAGGYTMTRPEEDSSYMSGAMMHDSLVMLLGGRVAEKILNGDRSTGPSSDLSRATDLARAMVTKYGMSERLGPVVYGKENDEVFLGLDYSHTKNYSDEYATLIDDEVKRILNECEEECEKILTDHIDKLRAVADTLIAHEKIKKDTFIALMEGTYVEPEQTAETPAEMTAEVPADVPVEAPVEEPVAPVDEPPQE